MFELFILNLSFSPEESSMETLFMHVCDVSSVSISLKKFIQVLEILILHYFDLNCHHCIRYIPKNAKELVNFRIACKQWSLGNHFGKDTADAPLVNGSRVTGRV